MAAWRVVSTPRASNSAARRATAFWSTERRPFFSAARNSRSGACPPLTISSISPTACSSTHRHSRRPLNRTTIIDATAPGDRVARARRPLRRRLSLVARHRYRWGEQRRGNRLERRTADESLGGFSWATGCVVWRDRLRRDSDRRAGGITAGGAGAAGLECAVVRVGDDRLRLHAVSHVSRSLRHSRDLPLVRGERAHYHGDMGGCGVGTTTEGRNDGMMERKSTFQPSIVPTFRCHVSCASY